MCDWVVRCFYHVQGRRVQSQWSLYRAQAAASFLPAIHKMFNSLLRYIADVFSEVGIKKKKQPTFMLSLWMNSEKLCINRQEERNPCIQSRSINVSKNLSSSEKCSFKIFLFFYAFSLCKTVGVFAFMWRCINFVICSLQKNHLNLISGTFDFMFFISACFFSCSVSKGKFSLASLSFNLGY